MSIEEAIAIQRVKHVLLSPDGTHVIYFKNDVIWLAKVEKKKPVQHQEIGKGNVPHWLPNSKGFVYLSDFEGGKQELKQFTIATGETTSLASFEKNISKFKLSPDAKQIAYVQTEKAADRRTRALWIQTLETGTLEKVTSLNLSISLFEWSPNGKQIAFAAQPNTSMAGQAASRGYILNLKTKKLTSFCPVVDEKERPVFSPKWTNDGKMIYFLTSDGFEDAWLSSLEIGAYTLKNKKCVTYPETGKKEISRLYGHSTKGKEIYFLAEEGFGYNLYALCLKKGKLRPITNGSRLWEDFSFSKDFSKAAFTLEDGQTAPELYVSKFPKLDPQQITTLNTAVQTLELGQTEIISWKSSDGQVIEGLLVKPVSYDPNKQYPMVVWLHGGPASCFSNRFANGTWHYPTQVMAGEGYITFMPNPRGSTGYGPEFKRALQKQWGEIDYNDVTTGIDYVVNELKIAKPESIGVVGWSYGGYLTSVMISKSNRFKMASIGAGFSDLVTLYDTIDIPDWMESYLGTTPKKDKAFYVAHSPYYKMDQITMPVLIQHGTKDKRVPVSQARLLNKLLKDKKKTVVLQEYKDETHTLTKTENKRQSMKLNMDWFKKYLK